MMVIFHSTLAQITKRPDGYLNSCLSTNRLRAKSIFRTAAASESIFNAESEGVF
jgi:hypothetical protein